jgi:ankyrin repeat protein
MTRPLEESERTLLKAAAAGDATMLNILAWRLKNFNVRDKHGNTALHLACERSVNKEEAVKLLAGRKDVSVNAQNNAGETPLHKTAVQGDTRAITALLAAHANPFLTDKLGQAPAHRFLVSGFYDGLEALLNGFYGRRRLIDQQDSAGNTLMHLAALHAPALLPDLLARGGSVCIRNADGALPEELGSDDFARRLVHAARAGATPGVSQTIDSPTAELSGSATPTPSAETVSLDDDEYDLLGRLAQKARDYLADNATPPSKLAP